MSESVYGVELPTLRDAIAAHELQGYEDLGPYIFTKVSKKKKGTSSSGFGPGQITASTAEDMLARYPSLFDDEFRDYVNRFVTQGTNKLNIDYYGSLYKDGDRVQTSKADREMFGPLGRGNIPEEDHAKFYNRLFDLVIRDKAKNAKDLDSFLQNYHGAGTGGTKKNIDYAQSVQKKLEGLGVSVGGAADPTGFGGMPLPMPKPEKEPMPMPTPKPDREQYIDQEGEIADTGEDVEMEEPGLLERIKPFVPVYRHMNEGGMAKQMELFEDGGLRQEGGTVDPVSGNDVPPGSMQEEVRDDIPAQLSEGEFVFPADVVRYIGLEKLMQMRQEAKQGLQMMEDMGQMGNGDEAIMPDDIPFDLSDLDMDDDLEYNVGGFVPGVQQQQFTGIAGYRPPQMQQGVGSYVPAPMPQYQASPMPGAYTPPQQAAVPIMQTPAQMPQFEQFTEQNVENREYTNSETGEKRVFTFINGQPTIPIPPGFVPSSEYVKPETAKPEDVKVETASVTEQDTSDRDERRRKEEEEKYGPGGGRLGVAGNIYGVSFDTAGEGLPGMAGMATTLGKVVSGNLPDDTIVNFQNPQTGQFSISGSQYNNLKAIISGEGANSPTAKQYINDLRQDYDDSVRNIANEYRLDSSGKSSSQIIKEASEASGQDAADLIRGAKARRDLQKHNEEVARKAAEKRRQEEKAEAARLNREAEIRRQAEAQRQADAAAAGKAAATSDREDNESDRQGRGQSIGGGGVSSSVRDAIADAGRRDESVYSGGGRFGGFAEGGLASKPRPKTKKKMKRGGLASKK